MSRAGCASFISPTTSSSVADISLPASRSIARPSACRPRARSSMLSIRRSARPPASSMAASTVRALIALRFLAQQV